MIALGWGGFHVSRYRSKVRSSGSSNILCSSPSHSSNCLPQRFVTRTPIIKLVSEFFVKLMSDFFIKLVSDFFDVGCHHLSGPILLPPSNVDQMCVVVVPAIEIVGRCRKKRRGYLVEIGSTSSVGSVYGGLWSCLHLFHSTRCVVLFYWVHRLSHLFLQTLAPPSILQPASPQHSCSAHQLRERGTLAAIASVNTIQFLTAPELSCPEVRESTSFLNACLKSSMARRQACKKKTPRRFKYPHMLMNSTIHHDPVSYNPLSALPTHLSCPGNFNHLSGMLTMASLLGVSVLMFIFNRHSHGHVIRWKKYGYLSEVIRYCDQLYIDAIHVLRCPPLHCFTILSPRCKSLMNVHANAVVNILLQCKVKTCI